MALFGKRRSVQRVLEGDWSNKREQQQLLDEVRRSGLSSAQSIPLICHANADVREAGIDLFVRKPAPADLRELVIQLSGSRAPSRGLGSQLLSKIPPAVAAKGLDELLTSKASQVRRLAWDFSLSLAGDARLPYVRRALEEAPAATRMLAMQRVARIQKTKEAVDVLLTGAADADGTVAEAALEQLGDVPDSQVLELMIEKLSAGDASSRSRAMTYLRDAAANQPDLVREPLMSLLGGGDDALRHLAVELLLVTSTPEEVLEGVLEFARNLVGWLRNRIMETLLTLGDDILEPAIKLLNHPDETVRTMALVLSERFDDPRVVQPVCKLLSEPDWWLRISACDTLGRLKNKDAVPYLVRALKDDECRWAAIDALAQIGSEQAIEPLARLLTDKRPEVRVEVVRALGRLAGAEGYDLLQHVADRDPVTAVRSQAADAMRQMADRLDLDVMEIEEDSVSVASSELKRPIDRLLAEAREMGASDLHVSVGEPPLVRIHGRLSRLEGWKPLDARTATQAITSILDERHRQLLNRNGETDFCHYVEEVGRYRGNAYIQRKGPCAAFRVIPNSPPSFADLRLPGHLTELLDYHQGMIVVSGSAGSGKSTTLTALVNLINESKPVHVITLEDPVEFVHPIKSALINQREVGSHTESFGKAIRAALREDPDVVMVGEMRDTETIRMALMAAETGHLVIATLHTTNAVQTIDRLIKAFPPEEQPQVRMTLSETLKYVVCQALLPRKDEQGRVAMFEVPKNTFSVSAMIRDDKTYQIPNLMQLGYRVGMRTADNALMDLVESDLIAPELAWTRAISPGEFEALCNPKFIADAPPRSMRSRRERCKRSDPGRDHDPGGGWESNRPLPAADERPRSLRPAPAGGAPTDPAAPRPAGTGAISNPRRDRLRSAGPAHHPRATLEALPGRGGL